MAEAQGDCELSHRHEDSSETQEEPSAEGKCEGLGRGEGGKAVAGGQQDPANNTATGYKALINNTTGHFNTAAGYSALASNTTGEKNTGFWNVKIVEDGEYEFRLRRWPQETNLAISAPLAPGRGVARQRNRCAAIIGPTRPSCTS